MKATSNESEPEYTFRITANYKYITIRTREGMEKPYPVTYLKQIVLNSFHNYPDPIREMARQALAEFDLLREETEEEIVSETLLTIQGIKVYQVFAPARRFMAWLRGEKIYDSSLSEIERRIKGG